MDIIFTFNIDEEVEQENAAIARAQQKKKSRCRILEDDPFVSSADKGQCYLSYLSLTHSPN